MLEKLLLGALVLGLGYYAVTRGAPATDARPIPAPFPGNTPFVRMPGASNESLNATYFYQQVALGDFVGDPIVMDAEFRRRFRVPGV